MDKKEILELVKTGEGYTLEFKESLNSSIGKEICAFANASGGKIILGVKDDNSIKGYKLKNSDNSKIQDIIRNMDPSFHMSIEQVNDLVITSIPEGKEKPYTVNGHFYLRQGANSQQLKRDEIRSLFQRENLIRFDRKANPEFNMKNDFDKEKFKSFIAKAGIDSSLPQEHVLQNLGLMTEDKLNNAGVLFFSHRISKFFFNSIIACVLYDGTTKSRILDKQEFDADFVSNFNNAVIFALKTLKTEYIIEKVEREEKHEIPEKVLRELIMNAMIHRDYFSEGRVLIEIYADRVEISNPGGLLFKKSDLGKKSLARNPLIVDLVHRLRFVERMGSGIMRIKEIMKDKIKFDIHPDWFFAIIKRDDTVNVPKNVPKNVSKRYSSEEREEMILERIRNNKKITKRKLAKEFNVSDKTIQRDFDNLKNKIEFVGSKKSGRWIIKK